MNIWKSSIIAVACAAALLSAPTLGEQVGSKQSQCKTGPVTKLYGGPTWLVYSCDDDRSVVIVSAPGSPAAPFYFSYFPEAGGYHLSGE
ncbi:MAG: hypothetical protein WDN03_00930 [Rhizomicrobium sp.]